jgi:hypothetical protein
VFRISVNYTIRSFYIVKPYKNSILALHSYISGFWDIYLIVPRCPSRQMLIRREFRDHPIETRENCTSFPPPLLVILFDQCACTRAAEHINGSRITRDIMSELIAAKIFRLLSRLHFHALPDCRLIPLSRGGLGRALSGLREIKFALCRFAARSNSID